MANASEKITYVEDVKASKRESAQKLTVEASELGIRIGVARKALGMTRNGLAEHAGISRKLIQKWEMGELEPRLNQLSHLASAMNVSLVWLMSGEHTARPGTGALLDRKLVADATLAELRSTKTMIIASLERLSEIEVQVEQLVELD